MPNLDEDSEREKVYFSRCCYSCLGLSMKGDSFFTPLKLHSSQLAVKKGREITNNKRLVVL